MRNLRQVAMHARSVLTVECYGQVRRPVVGGVPVVVITLSVLIGCIVSSRISRAQDLPLSDDPVVLEGESGRLALVEARRVVLDESLTFLSDAASIDFFDDGSFVIVSNEVANVVHYSRSGRQRRVIGAWGPGPGEYESPKIARTAGGTVFVRDDGQNKYAAFDTSGALINEWTRVPGGPHDFVVADTWVVALTGQSFDYLIRGFDTASDDTLAAVLSDIELASMHVVGGVGSVGLRGESFYFAIPSKNEFRSLNLRDGRISVFDLPEADYRSKPYPFMDREDINLSFFDNRMVAYALKNSRTEGVRVLDEYILAIRGDGELPVEEGETIPEHRQRKRKYFVHDEDLQLVDVIPLDYARMRVLGYAETGVGENSVYFVVKSSDDGGRNLTWTMLELELREL